MNEFIRNLQIFLGGIGWRDVLDIVIVWVLLYYLFRLIRGSQAVQLLVGLAVLFVIGFVAQQLQLRLLSFVFANGAQAILIAAVVLFQPELRRALDQVGRLGLVRSFLGHHPNHVLVGAIEQIAAAVEVISERHWGALIVIEQKTGLENLTATGVHLDGILSSEALVTLFMPGTPLHDGAAIVRGDRIVAAGCVLPMAENLPPMGRLGTRHRAAVSLTLQSDALVVVVSEETSAISMVRDGQLSRGLNPLTLRQALVQTLGLGGNTGRPLAGYSRQPSEAVPHNVNVRSR